MRLSIHGAARTVTGSCHLLECRGRRILVDCGFFQGGRELEEENRAPFGFDPASIDFVLLTHAHLDHVGRLPLLSKRGFRGEVIATAATLELTRLVLLDSTHLQSEEARRRDRRHDGRHDPVGQEDDSLYSMVDTLDIIGRFGRQASYGRPFALADGIRVTFLDAGHILGSASLFFEIEEGGRTTTILFSGDIGNEGRPLLRDPQTPPSADYVVMEGTYGDRNHRPFADSVEELFAAVREALGRGANALIPTFALERTQDILFAFHRGVRDRLLPATMPVFLDSPMAISATEIFRRHPECFPPEIRRSLSRPNDPFSLAGLHLTRETIDSVAINRITGGAVIMAGSGMCTGGRIRHHLIANIDNPAAGIIFVGFAAQGTLARRIIDGARHVRILGDEVAVRAHIHTINGFSAHAGRRELIDWHNRVKSRKATFLVHAEARAMSALAKDLRTPRLEMPALHQAFEL